MKNSYHVLAFYHFTDIGDPQQEVLEQKNFLEPLDVTCRIYISNKGINGQMSAIESHSEIYMKWMQSRPIFNHVHFKIHHYHEHVFPRKTIKYRPQLVAYDETIDLSNRGKYLSPTQWKEALESFEDFLLLDVRNEYEWKLGHFEGASLPPCETFREFKEYANQLEETKDPQKTPVLMYCTGGIRCELYSSILKEKGFEQVYQLEGGIINYGLLEGNQHWKGKLFVFDDRLSVPISDEPTDIIGSCHHCQKPNESYYNCANMDCNALFLCCPDCLIQFKGCCKESCGQAQRLRPYHHQDPHKPFRKWYHYTKDKKKI